ncbi:hypothetical protein CX648_11175 [Aeromonas dhakensis]|nr:hypothetical protein CX648_11175 [Aeromonas dhakensis]
MDEILPVQGGGKDCRDAGPMQEGAVPAATLFARHRRKDERPKAEHRRKAGVLNSMAAGPAGRAVRAV